MAKRHNLTPVIMALAVVGVVSSIYAVGASGRQQPRAHGARPLGATAPHPRSPQTSTPTPTPAADTANLRAALAGGDGDRSLINQVTLHVGAGVTLAPAPQSDTPAVSQPAVLAAFMGSGMPLPTRPLNHSDVRLVRLTKADTGWHDRPAWAVILLSVPDVKPIGGPAGEEKVSMTANVVAFYDPQTGESIYGLIEPS